MFQNTAIPAPIREAVTAMLRPYGINFVKLIQKGGEESKEPRYISVAEAEKCFGLGRWTLGRLIRAGKIVSAKLSPARSGKVLINRDSLVDYLENCKLTKKGNKEYEQ